MELFALARRNSSGLLFLTKEQEPPSLWHPRVSDATRERFHLKLVSHSPSPAGAGFPPKKAALFFRGPDALLYFFLLLSPHVKETPRPSFLGVA